ncbi:methylmalonyl-CoA mutase family protein [Spirosoma endophyticum]|uniref:Heterodimeric methylmalonyl-CoA mutase small subunit n=1 Tax=Spirosoma endophyticum TaxID=662367 RepID=A0A1I1XQ39_9BACT|nr:methylmalonyl-CoA mutase family protein [Spirosoma endophyticum]SFE09465.1 heterodimeric methylmalonyl-CoA mutase small subunit [Spirosoma endophyticum]
MEPLFSTLFPAADKAAWLAQVQKELKNESAYENLLWQTEEGFTVEPYYTAGEMHHRPLKTVQDSQKQAPGWLNAPEQQISDEKSDNVLLRDVLARGADALVLRLSSQTDLSRLLNGIKLSDTPIFFRLDDNVAATDFVKALKIVAPYQLKGGLLTGVRTSMAEITRLTADSPLFRTVSVGSHEFHNAGANATQELAFTLASLADAYDQLTNEGLPIDQLVPKTLLSISVGTSYFLEIAKLRALRVLMNRFLSAYSSITHPISYTIHTQTSTFYDSAATPYTNLLRSSTEAMAAVIGGCDVLTVHPYDNVLDTSSNGSADRNHADRIARNVSVLLKEESYLDKVADPSAGSYYIETLTSQLVDAAWTLFLDVEKRGGFTKALAAGFIQQEIERSYQAKVEAIRSGKVLVGVTKFRFDESSNQTHHVSKNGTGSLPNRRLAEEFE